MTDTTWRDVYDDPEGMACALDEIEKWLIARSYHPDASTVGAAAACIREQAERIAELEARPTPAPGLPWVDIVECLPELGPGRVLVIPRYGSDDNLGEPTTAPISLLHEQPDLYAYWCELSAIALPGQPAPEQEGRLLEALTPSDATWWAYSDEFTFAVGDNEDDEFREVYVPWTTIKEIMAAIRERAALTPERPGQEGGGA